MKKVIAFWLAAFLVMLTPVVPSCINAQQAKARTGFTHLVNLGIFSAALFAEDGDTPAPREILTRAELASVLANLVSENIPESTTAAQAFLDVPDTHAAAGAITFCAGMGLMVGDGNGNFRPEAPVSPMELAKVLADLLGYGPKARATGGYPTGYRLAARELRLFREVDETNAYLLREDGAQMLFTALCQMPLEVSSFEQERTVFYKSDEPLLYQLTGLSYTEGIVTGNSRVQLSGPSLAAGQISIDGEVYRQASSYDLLLLGQRVECVYRANGSDTPQVVSILPALGQQETLFLTSRDIAAAQDNEILYQRSGDKRMMRVKLAAGVTWVDNWALTLHMEWSEILSRDASLELRDINQDNVYDLAIVRKYQPFIVETVTAERATDKLGGKALEANNPDISDMLLHDVFGTPVAWSKLQTGDVLSVVSVDGLLDITTGGRAVGGTIDGIEDSVGGRRYLIAGQECQISNSYQNAPLLSPGDYATAYLNFNNEVIYLQYEAAKGVSAGYLLGIKKPAGSLSALMLKLLTQSGDVTVFSCAERVLVNDVPYSATQNGDHPFLRDALTQADGSTMHQVILYDCNEDGLIRAITLAQELTDGMDGFYCSQPSASMDYIPANNSFNGVVNLNGDSVVFHVPMQIDDADDSAFEVISDRRILYSIRYQIEGYSLSRHQFYTPYVVIRGNLPRIRYDTKMAVILKKSRAVHEDEEGWNLQYNQGGEIMTRFVRNHVDTSELEHGDVVRLGVHEDGTITDIQWLYDYSTSKWKGGSNPTSTLFSSSERFGMATVAAIQEGYARLSFNGAEVDFPGRLEAHRLSDYTIITITDSSRGCIVEKGDASSVELGDTVIFQQRSGTAVLHMYVLKESE